MLDLLLKALEKAIELLTHRQSRRREKLASVVDPILAEFESAHEEYLVSFAQYRERIADGESFTNIIAAMRNDNLYKATKRLKIVALLKAKDIQDDPSLAQFKQALDKYLHRPREEIDWDLNDPSLHKVSAMQGMRNRVMHELREIDPEGDFYKGIDPAKVIVEDPINRQMALYTIDRAVNDLQQLYKDVVLVYGQLNQQLRG